MTPLAALSRVALQANTSTTQVAGSAGGALANVVIEVVVALVLLGVLGFALTRLVERVAIRAGASKSVARSVREWVALLMVTIAVVAVARITGISSELTTLTVSGIGGLIVSLALQNTLSNIISGVLMLEDGIIRLGDEIQFGSVKGEVVKVNMRSTWVRGKDGVITVVGNSNLAAGPIVNLTARDRLQRKLQA